MSILTQARTVNLAAADTDCIVMLAAPWQERRPALPGHAALRGLGTWYTWFPSSEPHVQEAR